LPAVLYGCETWSLTLREEHRLRVFENRVLRRIFGPKRDEVTSWVMSAKVHIIHSTRSTTIIGNIFNEEEEQIYSALTLLLEMNIPLSMVYDNSKGTRLEGSAQ
jgi:hypothetical protein